MVRSIAAPRRLATARERDDYEQELVDQYLLASMGAGCCDATLAADRSMLFEFIGFPGRPVWTANTSDADRYLAFQRMAFGRAHSTVHKKAVALGNFFDFLVVRYQAGKSSWPVPQKRTSPILHIGADGLLDGWSAVASGLVGTRPQATGGVGDEN